jgi:hypothetical protein
MIKSIKVISIWSWMILSMLVILTLACWTGVRGEDRLQRATFAVHCYDVGAQVLAEQVGVLDIQRGWEGREEVDRVLFDPQQVTLPQLESELKQSDTYIRTIAVETVMETDK